MYVSILRHAFPVLFNGHEQASSVNEQKVSELTKMTQQLLEILRYHSDNAGRRGLNTEKQDCVDMLAGLVSDLR